MADGDLYNVNDGRHFDNPYIQEDSKNTNLSNGKLSTKFRESLLSCIRRLSQILEDKIDFLDYKDTSVYTGLAGVSYFYWKVATTDSLTNEEKKKAEKYCYSLLRTCYKNLRGKRETFLCGDAGPLTLLIFTEASDRDKHLQKLINLHFNICDSSDIPDEFLYGRCGYLYSLLLLKKHGFNIDSAIIKKVIDATIVSGRRLANSTRIGPPLMYQWHDSFYLGAAHGLVGILVMLFQAYLLDSSLVSDEVVNKDLRPTLEWMCSLRYPSGNYPSSLESKGGDRLIHWCHGAPGWIHMFLLGHKVYHDPKYLHLAEECGEVVWRRGLLQKGCGICHGVAGNAYVFLTLYSFTKDEKHLHRATKFAEWIFDYEEHNRRLADRPYSLFEGLAGTIYFLVDLLDPVNAKFPAFIL